jgi:predicted glycogen debranching enzyme
VVTPRRGKAVEINALWYNGLRLMEHWISVEKGETEARSLTKHARWVKQSFNKQFWYEARGYLFDVVDGEMGDDPTCRPNQILAISLRFPILERSRWQPVMDVVTKRLLTPVGLRSLSPGHPDYKTKYFGDIHTRDAAYH